MDVVVLDIDVENRRLSLGHKQAEDNPFETYATLLEEGSVIEGKVLRKVDKGAEIVFENLGVEAFVPSRHMVKEDGSEIEADERIDFKIIEFNADGRRVVASHTELHKKLKAEKAKVEKTKATKAVNSNNSNVERSTLGDLDALSQLKQKMEEGDEKEDK